MLVMLVGVYFLLYSANIKILNILHILKYLYIFSDISCSIAEAWEKLNTDRK